MTKKFVRKAELEVNDFSILPEVFQSQKDFVSTNLPPLGKAKVVIEVEEEDGVGQFYFHIHHQILIEKATEPIQNRQDYISKNKSDDAATRLKWMTPVIGPLPEGFEEMYDRVYKGESPATSKNILHSLDIERLHKKEHPDCPWNKHPGDLLP